MNLNPTLFLLTVILLLVSCSTPRFVTNDEEYPKIGLDLVADAIVIEDRRENVSISDDLELPFISHRGQYDIVVPPLKSDHEEIIKQTILDNLDSESTLQAFLTVQVLNARKEFSATYWSERETSMVELKIVAKVGEKEIVVLESGEYIKKSIDATYKRSERIFKNALKEVTYKALKKLEHKICS
ncbi:hypothetical protein F8C76_04120 [Flagellimonas olearia]|uniref:Uncharacterized protein n=1 Tax=Flagellimonas olearia TaxID=552546 RepID=A0A6I1EAC2_9FLAO|nr:hypothetical protein [Allomuricauda olearia]KAB7530694.1 hypothetical protein F8C76_04120 [Allomuricauda olearia]